MASRNEVSAGGVVYRQGDNGVEVLICKDAGYRRWVLPKGLVGKGESLEGTALREVEEEVNVKARLVDSLGEEKYVYKARGVVVFKSVYYFLMEYQSGSISPQEREIEAVQWLPIDEAIETLAYKGAKEVVKRAKELLKNHLTSHD
jgi:8-oxo-dGTP pyrophosphatase MutT (NUDIX family)